MPPDSATSHATGKHWTVDREIAALTAELADVQARLLVKQLYAGSRRGPDLGEPLRIPRPRPDVAKQQPAPAEPEQPELSSREEMLAFFGKTDPTTKG